MRKTIILMMVLVCAAVSAQTSRKKIERFATEAVKQIALTGRTPSIDILDSLANNAEVSIEMISRMGEPDDIRQSKACLKLIDGIVDYSLTATGRRYVDIVRGGLKKALDRSYETDVQQHVMEQLGRCAKPADAAHIAMYLEVPELAPTARQILVGMPEADNAMAEAAAAQPGIKDKVQAILDVHDGKTPPAAAPQPVKARPKPAAVPLWTVSLDRIVADMAKEAGAEAEKIEIGNSPEKALPMLLGMAGKTAGKERDAAIARFLSLAARTAIAPERMYLMLRAADGMTSDTSLKQRIIVALGDTHTIQALAYLRKYYGKAEYADALAIAAAGIISCHPEANGGSTVNGMLYNAKQSFIRHYDEQGIDALIDQTLAAIDNWKPDRGYNFNHTEETRMETRGFWVMHDQLADFDMVFDWRAQGTLTLFLRSVPVLMFDTSRGARVGSDTTWHKFAADNDWATVGISASGGNVSVFVNGQKVIDNARLSDIHTGGAAEASGFVKFLADDLGATVRGYCFLKR